MIPEVNVCPPGCLRRMFVLFVLFTMHLARPSAARAHKVVRVGPTACKSPRRFCDVGFPRHCRLQTPIPWQGRWVGGFCQVYIAAYRLDCAHLPDCCFLAPRPRKIRSSNSPIRWLQLKAASTSRRPLPALPTPSTHLSPLSTPHHNLASSAPSHKAWGHTCHQFASA